MKENKTPQTIVNAAKSLIEIYGENFSYLGRYDGADAYVYEFPKDSSTGYPFVYLLKEGVVTEVTGDIALHIINLTIEDAGI